MKGLPSGQLKGVKVAVLSQFVDHQPLLCSRHPTRQTDACQKGVCLVELVLPAIVANIPVVLLVNTVEFRQLLIVRIDRTLRSVRQTFQNGSAQVVAAGFNTLIFMKFCCALAVRNHDCLL